MTTPTASGHLASGLLGRDHPTALLHAEIDRVASSHGGLVLVAGEAGIGKSTLVTEAVRSLDRSEVFVAFGTAWEGSGAPGYWPWTQVVRSLQRVANDDQWAATAEVHDELACFLHGGDERPSCQALTEPARFQLHDAVAGLLVALSQQRAVVIVLDDLHWADEASLRLLEFVVRHTWFERVLVVATYRDVEVAAPDHPLRGLLPNLLGMATTITLDGLGPREVGEIIARTSGRRPTDDLVTEIHRRTAGNPFFVEQLASLWHSGGSIDTIPAGIQHVLERRFAPLSPTAMHVLQTAALIGREFDPDLLAAASGVEHADLTTAIQQAVAGRLVRRTEGRLGFVHDLVCETLEMALDPEERRRRHLDILRALDALDGSGRAELATERAHHAYLAVPVLDPDTAIERLLAAADHARSRLAVEEVEQHHRRALELVPSEDQGRRAQLTVEHAVVLTSVGRLDQARTILEQQLEVARDHDVPERFASIVLGLHALGLPDPDGDLPRELELLTEANRRLERAGVPDEHPLRVRLLATTSRTRALERRSSDDGVDAMSEEALRLARRSGDDEVLGSSLRARHDVIWRPGTARDRLELTREMRLVADRTGDTELLLHSSLQRFAALLELGEPEAATEQARLDQLATRHRSARFRYVARSRAGAIATLQGRFDAARDAVDDALALGEQLGEVDRHRLWIEQRWALALLRGDLDDADRMVEHYRSNGEGYETMAAAVTAAARGRTSLPPHHLGELLAAVDEWPDMFRATTVHALAHVAIATGDEHLGARVRDELEPLHGAWAVVAGGGVVFGPYDHWLAGLQAAQGEWDAAAASYRAALTSAERLGARPWAVLARLGLAETLVAGSGAPRLVADLLEQAQRAAQAMGMRAAAERARSLAAPPPARTSSPNPAPGKHEDEGGTPVPEHDQPSPADEQPPAAAPVESAPASFRPDGEVWELTFAGRTVRVPPTKGLKDLYVLIGSPGTDIAAVDLLDPAGGATVTSAKRLGSDPVLDDEARAAYRRRLTSLDDLIERATAQGDDGRAVEFDREREALLDELRAATGLGGRPRRLGDEAERARKTVTARIRDTLRRLDAQHPELAEHLRASVSTGATCAYRPSREVAWQLETSHR